MSRQTPSRVLRIDASMRHAGSQSRALTDRVIERLRRDQPELQVQVRDLAEPGLRFIDEAWINANFTDPAERSDDQKAALARSDALVEELRQADTIVIGTPVYNYTIPAALKAWIDMVVRARETFRYTEAGPEGFLKGKRAIIVFTSGGTELGGDNDFASGYLRYILGFIGITDVEFIDVSGLAFDAEERVAAASETIETLAA